MGAYETSKAALDELVRAWRGEHPEIGFCNVAVGNTLGTEVHQSWDRDLLSELSPVWESRGYVHDNGPGAMSVARLRDRGGGGDHLAGRPALRRRQPGARQHHGHRLMSETEPAPGSLAPLRPWLEARIPMAEAVELLGVRKASSGFSADTMMVDVAVTRGGIANEERYVLRTESPDPPVYPVQVPGWQVEIELQYRIMDALGPHADVPVAPMIGYEADPSVLGAPFFVMGFVDGQVPVEDPPYTTAGFFLDLPPAERTR